MRLYLLAAITASVATLTASHAGETVTVTTTETTTIVARPGATNIGVGTDNTLMNSAWVVATRPPADLTDPFVKPCIRKESLGAQWRHTFHHMRNTWDKYFEVYEKELDHSEGTTLERIRAEPGFYLDKMVQFDLFWGRAGSFYRPFVSPFHEEGYVNFSAWPYGSDLWLKESREQVGMLFYVDRRRKDLIDKLVHLPMYTPVHVWGQERSKSENLPWIEIKGAEIIPETALQEVTLKHMELGVKQMVRKRYDLAAQSFGKALELQMPVIVEAKAWALLGRAYFELRDFESARNAYAEAVTRDDSVVINLIYLARSDEHIQRYDEAHEAAEHAVTLAPANPEARAELGLALAMLGDVKTGLKELEYAQKLAPRNQLPDANRNRAIIFLRDGKLELAKLELKQAVVLRAADPILHMELGEVHLALNELEEARREFGFAKELAPTRPEPYLKYAFISRVQGDILRKEGKLEEAKKLYLEALENVRLGLKYDDSNDGARALEFDMLKELGREKEAEKSINGLLERKPDNPEYLDRLYACAVKLGQWDVMEKSAQKALELSPNAARFVRLANVLASRPNPDLAAAAKNYEAALKAEPDNATAWFELAQVRMNQNDISNAINAADRAVETAKSIDARLLAVRVRLELPEPDPATVAMARALNVEAKDDLTRAQAQALLGAALLQGNNPDAAGEAFAKAEPQLRDNAEFEYWYSLVLLRRKDVEGAKLRLKSAIELSAHAAVQSASTVRTREKALEEIVKLDPSYQARAGESSKLPEPGKIEPTNTVKSTAEKPLIRKILPPVIEDDGPTPIPTELPRPK